MTVIGNAKIIENSEQGSERWHQLRVGRLTASRLYPLVCPSKFSTQNKTIMSIVTGNSINITRPMQVGSNAEKHILKAFQNAIHKDVIEVGLAYSLEHPLIHASADGVIKEADGTISIVEIKTFSSSFIPNKRQSFVLSAINNNVTIGGFITEEHYAQMQVTAGVYGASKIYYVTYNMPDTNIMQGDLVYESIKFDKPYYDNLVSKSLEIYDRSIKPLLPEN
jgi:hypothetical protein